MLIPLNRVDVESELRGATALTNVELTYVNPYPDSPLECTFLLPLLKTSTLLAKFEATIEGRTVVTKVMAKEKA